MSANRVQLEPAYVVHTRAYRETSLLVEAISRHYGRVGLVARGGRKRWKGELTAFSSLLISWSGRGELKTLTHVEVSGQTRHLAGKSLVTGLYVNELLLKLTARHDPLEPLFDAYHLVIDSLGGVGFDETPLRQFEITLLTELGYDLNLDKDADTGEQIAPDGRYRYELEHGPVQSRGQDRDVYSGEQLLKLAAGNLDSPDTLRAARRLTRRVIQYYLGDKPLRARELWR